LITEMLEPGTGVPDYIPGKMLIVIQELFRFHRIAGK